MTTIVDPLPTLLVEPVVRAALREDLGRAGDITSTAVIGRGAKCKAVVAARVAGTLAGTDAAALAFRLLDPEIAIAVDRPDGATVEPGDIVMRIDGPARSVLAAERVALNLLCHLSGVATSTATLACAARPHRARITCTRKTTPNLRALEKHAVRAGGGVSHRFGLDDGVLIKDNHIAIAGGITRAVRDARRASGHMVRIEVEVDDLAGLEEALAAGVDAVLLDNMPPATLREAVARIDGRAIAEASGRITAETVADVAATGVDLISAGWITHSAPALDLGLDIESAPANPVF
ncbi:carboxylating nicotinate-nucleotide diphosphorylase [Ferruginivarius sediminum]|uniref:Probable nicotinate-nucleotide pyrophosphorylase [carboxylating] n=1 Tax=Ferruginivarius sediminum TaxID=2661937 RepID=A0A369T9G7_9PROT|nr:carboxylating nicotinate-nucleotide diphosphorylase [Ferruginivarius sediminum]RDD60817.1 carboxylating nicotinate-nucleotide diphosphorylase [Ferruginivarius sediminum]